MTKRLEAKMPARRLYSTLRPAAPRAGISLSERGNNNGKIRRGIMANQAESGRLGRARGHLRPLGPLCTKSICCFSSMNSQNALRYKAEKLGELHQSKSRFRQQRSQLGYSQNAQTKIKRADVQIPKITNYGWAGPRPLMLQPIPMYSSLGALTQLTRSAAAAFPSHGIFLVFAGFWARCFDCCFEVGVNKKYHEKQDRSRSKSIPACSPGAHHR